MPTRNRRLSDCREIAESRRNSARIQALKFDWRRIARRMLVVYQAVITGRAPSEALLEFEQNNKDDRFDGEAQGCQRAVVVDDRSRRNV
jgi:hypothetical protein